MIDYTRDPTAVEASHVEHLFSGWRKSPSIDDRLAILRAADAVVLAWSDSRLVGFVTAISDGLSWAYISLLEVLPEFRHQGIATELMRQILERYEDVFAIDLTCDDELVPFYERLGMHRLNAMVIRNHDARLADRPEEPEGDA